MPKPAPECLVLWEDIAMIGAQGVRLRQGFIAYSPALD
jgi:hypothetical protein